MGFFKSKMPLFLVLLSLFLSSALALRDLNPHDPERQYEQCRRQCQRQGRRGEGQQWQCQRRCQEEYQERGRDGYYGYGDIDAVYGEEEEDDNQGRYSHRECERRCERQGGQRWECQIRCQQEEMDDNQGRWDPQECQQRCQRQGRGSECHRRCQEEYRRGRHEVDENDKEMENPHWDPQERFRECQQRCQRQRGGQQQECQRRCQEEFERERHRGGGHNDDVQKIEVDDNEENPRGDPQECIRRCQRQRGQGQQWECQRRCQEEESQRGRHPDPQEQVWECQRRCQRQGQGQWECQKSCQQQHGQSHPRNSALASILELTAGLFN